MLDEVNALFTEDGLRVTFLAVLCPTPSGWPPGNDAQPAAPDSFGYVDAPTRTHFPLTDWAISARNGQSVAVARLRELLEESSVCCETDNAKRIGSLPDTSNPAAVRGRPGLRNPQSRMDCQCRMHR